MSQRHIRIPTFLLCLSAFASLAHANDVSIGGRSISVPTPDGFAELTPAMSPYYESTQAYVVPTNERYFSYIPGDAAAAILVGDDPVFSRNLAIESEKRISGVSVTGADFAELKRVFREQNQQVVDEVMAQIPEAFESGSERLSDEFDVDLAMSVNNLVQLPAHLDSERALGFSMYLNYQVDVDGQVESERLAVSTVILHVMDKVLFLHVYGGKDDLDWTRSFGEAWGKQILAANPVPAEIAAVVDSPARSASSIDWQQVLQKAAIGGGIGAVIGLAGWASRRRKSRVS